MFYKPSRTVYYQPEKVEKEEKSDKKAGPRTISKVEIEVGNKIELNNIHFEGGTTRILPKSYPELDELLEILAQHPKMKIEIRGHVNRPGKKNSPHDQALSLGRAKTIYRYLIGKGVGKNRLAYKGFGNTQMKYPKAKTAEQMQANRRVEIMIISI